MTTGKIKWFNNKKGYGFVQADNLEQDIFVHHSFIKGDGYKRLYAQQTISFEIQDSINGPYASNIIPLEKQPIAPNKKELSTP